MNLEARKLFIIQEFLTLQDEDSIASIEKLLQEKKDLASAEVRPMTLEELNKRIDRSLEDSKEGRLTESDKLLSEIKNWK